MKYIMSSIVERKDVCNPSIACTSMQNGLNCHKWELNNSKGKCDPSLYVSILAASTLIALMKTC